MKIEGKKHQKQQKYLDVLFFKDKLVIFKYFSRKNHHFQGKINKSFHGGSKYARGLVFLN